jgi:hypothetical protein
MFSKFGISLRSQTNRHFFGWLFVVDLLENFSYVHLCVSRIVKIFNLLSELSRPIALHCVLTYCTKKAPFIDAELMPY